MKSFKSFLSEATKTKTDKSLDDLFAQYLDGDAKNRQIMKPESPKKKNTGAKADKPAAELKRSSTARTAERMKGVRIDPSKVPAADFRNVDVSKEKEREDARAKVKTGAGYQEPLKLPPLSKNLPAIIQHALVNTDSKLARVNGDDIEWHMVRNLPGYMQHAIRAVGRSVFDAFTKTELEEIQVLAHVGGGPNSTAELNTIAGIVTKYGTKQNDLEINFHDIFKDYKADVRIYDYLGFTFFIMKDFAGSYIYAWPSKDTKHNTPHKKLGSENDTKRLPS